MSNKVRKIISRTYRRKIRVLFNTIPYFLVSLFFSRLGWAESNYLLLGVGISGLSLVLYPLQILFAKDIYSSDELVFIGKNKSYQHKNIVSVKKKKLNPVLRFFWSPFKTKFYQLPPYDMYYLTLREDDDSILFSFLVDNDDAKEFYEFISMLKARFSDVEITVLI